MKVSALPGRVFKARITTINSATDLTTRRLVVRSEVPNPDGLLLPGQYVRVRLAQAELPSAMLLPQQAVTRGNQGDTVLVVGADNKPQARSELSTAVTARSDACTLVKVIVA